MSAPPPAKQGAVVIVAVLLVFLVGVAVGFVLGRGL
jgi:hypothetical protein